MAQRLIIAGGGLSGVLTAVALANARPDLDLTVLEGGAKLGGDHTWSFYSTDVDGAAADIVEPFIGYRWDGYETRFQHFTRNFSTGYRSIVSERLHEVAMARLGDRVRLGVKVTAVDPAGVTLEGGERLDADAVIDARGARS
ncbi:MAG: lycopene cyclase family protein, partial [Pseudomonadota bacterium]